MIESERKIQVDVRLELLEKYIAFLKGKGLSDDEVQQCIMGLSEPLFKELLD